MSDSSAPESRPATAPRLRGRHALITGASRGIGSAVAVRYAEEGAVVAINYSGSEDAANETLRQARDASTRAGFSEAAGRHRTIQADVGDERAALAMVDDVLADWGYEPELAADGASRDALLALVAVALVPIGNHFIRRYVAADPWSPT